MHECDAALSALVERRVVIPSCKGIAARAFGVPGHGLPVSSLLLAGVAPFLAPLLNVVVVLFQSGVEAGNLHKHAHSAAVKALYIGIWVHGGGGGGGDEEGRSMRKEDTGQKTRQKSEERRSRW